MADFCLDCSKSLGAPEGWSDFSGIAKDGEVVAVLCEGCGFINVDSTGRRVPDPEPERSPQ